MKPLSFRYLTLVSHRWLGIATAAVLSVVGLTGVALTWQGHWLVAKLGNAERLHVDLGMGGIGNSAVFYSTVLSVPLIVGGVYLWWKRKIIRVETRSGLRRALADLHHSLGVVGLALMLLLAVTGIGMTTVPRGSSWRQIVVSLHTARGYPLPIKLIYAMGTTAFFVQAVTGIVMWWKPATKRSPKR